MINTARFRNKQGLTAYSLHCGYIQLAKLPKKGTEKSIHVVLWHEGACYSVRAHDHDEGKRLGWEAFDTLTEARRYWNKRIRELFGEELKSIKRDKRYGVSWEYTGAQEGPQYCIRFCGEYLGHYETELQAWVACAAHKMRRTEQ